MDSRIAYELREAGIDFLKVSLLDLQTGFHVEQVSYVPHPRLCLKINTSDLYYFLRIIGKMASNTSANVILTTIPEMNHSHPSVRICTVLLLGLNCHQVNSLQWR